MKFKQNDAQNQRIEHITSNHLVVGVDIAKETQVARAVTYRGIEIGRPCSFKGKRQISRWIEKRAKLV
uniref:hypothetical protein n=1 Tax=Paenibacillus cremeus TaxID=2163881 RepID=UPI0016489424